MPAYYSITTYINKNKINNHTFEEFINVLQEEGLTFKSGYRGFTDDTITEIIAWNTEKLCKDFSLGFEEHYSNDYKQSIWEYDNLSEVRLYIVNPEESDYFEFVIIIPEDDFIEYKKGYEKYDSKVIRDLKQLAVSIWKLEYVEAIQTAMELSSSEVYVEDIIDGEFPLAEPFAIISEDLLNELYQKKYKIKRIDRNGALIEKRGRNHLKKNIAAVLCTIFIIILPFLLSYIHKLSLTKDGWIGLESINIDGVQYKYYGYDFTDEGKVIAYIDDWRIKEIPEDPSHTFLVVRSLRDQYYIMRADYDVPESGKVSCAYIGGKRTVNKEMLDALTEIMAMQFTEGNQINLSNIRKSGEDLMLKSVNVGYEDCPVATDYSIYDIGKRDSDWIIIFRDELYENNNELCGVYYKLDSKFNKVFDENW